MAAGFDVEVGEWTAFQSNGWKAIFRLQQNNQTGELSGDADAQPIAGGNKTDGDILSGSKVDGNQFVCRVQWQNGPIGNYQGTHGLDGSLSGRSFDEANLASQATWAADRNFPRL